MIIPQANTLGGLQPRQNYGCPSGTYIDNYGNCQSSSWYYYGRWILAAVVIVFFIALFVSWSCISNRRRRRRGMQPMYGTGWMPYNHNVNPNQQQPQYNQGGWFGGFGHKNNNSNQPPPPQYTPAVAPQAEQYTGQTFNSNDGYYGHHQNDVPLQQPTGTYYPRGGDNVYEPPTGPPPAKS